MYNLYIMQFPCQGFLEEKDSFQPAGVTGSTSFPAEIPGYLLTLVRWQSGIE